MECEVVRLIGMEWGGVGWDGMGWNGIKCFGMGQIRYRVGKYGQRQFISFQFSSVEMPVRTTYTCDRTNLPLLAAVHRTHRTWLPCGGKIEPSTRPLDNR